MVNNTQIIYEGHDGSRATFRWCWQVNKTDLGMVCPWPGIKGSTLIVVVFIVFIFDAIVVVVVVDVAAAIIVVIVIIRTEQLRKLGN